MVLNEICRRAISYRIRKSLLVRFQCKILSQVLLTEALSFILLVHSCPLNLLYILIYETILCTMRVISFRTLMLREVF